MNVYDSDSDVSAERPAVLATESNWYVSLLYATSAPWALCAAHCSRSSNITILLRVLPHATSAAAAIHVGNIDCECRARSFGYSSSRLSRSPRG